MFMVVLSVDACVLDVEDYTVVQEEQAKGPMKITKNVTYKHLINAKKITDVTWAKQIVNNYGQVRDGAKIITIRADKMDYTIPYTEETWSYIKKVMATCKQ